MKVKLINAGPWINIHGEHFDDSRYSHCKKVMVDIETSVLEVLESEPYEDRTQKILNTYFNKNE